MIGLAQKAGKVASGEFSTEKAVKTGKAYTVIVADDYVYLLQGSNTFFQ